MPDTVVSRALAEGELCADDFPPDGVYIAMLDLTVRGMPPDCSHELCLFGWLRRAGVPHVPEAQH